VGWPIVFVLFFYRTKLKELVVNRQRSLELVFLAIATVYVILIPLRSHVTIVDSIVLVSLFGIYMYFTSKVESEHVELVGPARAMGVLKVAQRRGMVLTVIIFSAVSIFCSAEPFTESLIHIGEDFGVSEFLLIQWLAPLASESPEVLIACLLAWRGRAAAGMGVLISSKVNQWTLLVGTLPIVFAISSASTHGLPISAVQREELFLTAAQSFFAVAIMSNLSLSLREAGYLFGLFWAQFIVGALVPESLHAAERIGVGILYLALGLIFILRDRRRVPLLIRDAFVASHAELSAERLQDALREAEEVHPSPPHDDEDPSPRSDG